MSNFKNKEIMRTIKYLVMGVVLAGFSTTAMAQDGTKADVDAVKNIINSKPADLDKQMKPYLGKNKKNAENLVAFARAFYEAKDTANARVYANHALKAAKNNYAPAYILLGDIAALAEDGGGAAAQYEMAIHFDPKNAEAYRKYASVYRKISPAGAVAKLEELRQQVPDYPVDALIGHINYISNRFGEAIEAYDKVPQSKLEKMDIIESAFSAYLTQKYEKGIEMAKLGLQKEPRNSTLNRLAMFCNTELKNYPDALQFADKLFNQSDSANISYMDYVYYGNALKGDKQQDKAIEQFKKALEQEFDNKDKRAGVVKTLSDAYSDMDLYDEAILYYEQYLKEYSTPTATDHAGLPQLHYYKSQKLQGDERIAALKKADELYQQLQTNYPDAEEYATFWRARVNNAMDNDQEGGLAKPFYESLISQIEPKAEKSKSDTARLKEGYLYLISYLARVKNDMNAAKEVATKLAEIDPENEVAKQVLSIGK